MRLPQRILRRLAPLLVALGLAQPALAQDPRSCLALDTLTQKLNASAGSDLVQEIRGAYVEAGLAFGGERTSSRCSEALRALRVIERRMATGAPAPTSRRESIRYAASSGWSAGFGGQTLSYWTHNGSQMAYEAGPGAQRRIWYWAPRSGLRGIGLGKGALLFDGQLSGASISGTARIFKSGCGAYPYEVRGGVSSRGDRILMTGTRPVIDDACRVTGTRPDELIFELAGAAPPGVAPAPAPEPSQRIGVWSPSWRTHRLPAGDTLNVRSGPSTGFGVVGELPNGARGIRVVGRGCTPSPEARFFESLSADGKAVVVQASWCEIAWNGLSGWVYAKYIRPD